MSVPSHPQCTLLLHHLPQSSSFCCNSCDQATKIRAECTPGLKSGSRVASMLLMIGYHALFGLRSNQLQGVHTCAPVWYSCLVSLGPIGTLLVPLGPIWSLLVRFGPSWSLLVPSGPSLVHSTPTASVRAPIACERAGFPPPAKLTGSLCQEEPPLMFLFVCYNPPNRFPIVKNLIVFLFLFSVKYTFHYLPLLYHLNQIRTSWKKC